MALCDTPTVDLRKSKWIVLLLALSVGMAIFLLRSDPEPVYKGKRLSQWMNAFYTALGGDPETPEYLEAAAAVRHMGTNALPHLLKWISGKSSRSKARETLSAWMHELPERVVPKIAHEWICGDVRKVRVGQSMVGIQILGTNAAPALPQLLRLANDPTDEERAIQATRAMYEIGPQIIPALLQIIQNTNAPGRYAAMLPLASFGTNSLPAIPILLRCLDDPADDVRYGAADMLGRIGLASDQSVPGLMKCLENNPNPMAKAAAARSLALFGTSALPAIPPLHAALNDENEFVRRLAKEALSKIAPEVLTNAPAK